MTGRERLGLYIPVAKSQMRPNFFTYRNLRDFNKLLNDDADILGMSVQAFKNLTYRLMQQRIEFDVWIAA